MQRRKFLTLTCLSATVVAVPAVSFRLVSTKEAAVGIIMNELHYLTLYKPGVEQFVTDYLTYDNFTSNLHIKLKSYYLLGIRSDKSIVINSLVNKYLLSTDFFLNKMDESKLIKYLSLHSPYKSPCANPFSFMYYPAI